MSIVDKLFPVLSTSDIIRQKDMFLGANSADYINEFIATDKDGTCVITRDILLSNTAIIQTIKEIMSNVSDHIIKTREINKNKTFPFTLTEPTMMKVLFNSTNGLIQVVNDGNGFLIERHPQFSDISGRDVYIPEYVCTEMWGGSNHNNSDKRITAGRNGLGITMVAAVSEVLYIETLGHNAVNKKFKYQQTFRDFLAIKEPPIITPMPDNAKEYTVISYIPAYVKQFKVKVADKPIFLTNLNKIIHAYTIFMSCSLGSSIKTFFSNTYIKTNNISSLAQLMVNNGKLYNEKFTIDEQDWDVVIMVHKPQNAVNMSLINGLIVASGEHFDIVTKNVLEVALERAKSLVKRIDGAVLQSGVLTSCISLFIKATIPGITFDSQVKSKLSFTKKIKGKKLPFTDKFINDIAVQIENIIKEHILPGLLKPNINKKKEKVTSDKYEPAEYAGDHNKLKKGPCYLFLAEGDSAVGMVRKGIEHIVVGKNSGFTICGTYTLGGVIPNVMKKVQRDILPNTDQYLYDIPDKIRNNEVLKNLMLILGLDFLNNYSTQEAISKLHYTSVIAAVDNDLDGIGNILGLVVTYFHYFWPNLLKAGYLKIFRTPLIRARSIRGRDLKEFLSEDEFQRWRTEDKSSSSYKITYYKGLAGHEDQMVTRMFKNFSSYIVRYTPDAEFDKYINIFYGRDADLRKQQLTLPYTGYSIDQIEFINKHKTLPGTNHLLCDVMAFQLNNLIRKLPHVIDGFINVRRKIFANIYSHKSADYQKVFQVAGEVARRYDYHHGDMSINNSIIGMMQSFVGARSIPLLRRGGQAGTRNGTLKGIGTDAGSARYIGTKLNKEIALAMFPVEDIDILDYKYGDNGDRIEPEFYVPVLPIVILESETIPASGFKQERHARNIFEVANVVKSLIDMNYDGPLDIIDHINTYGTGEINIPKGPGINIIPSIKSISMDLSNYQCAKRIIDDKLYLVGKYKVLRTSPVEINITELPPYVGIEKYRVSLKNELTELYEAYCSKLNIKKQDDIFEVRNKTANDKVNIIVRIAKLDILEGLLGEENKLVIFAGLNNNNNIHIDSLEKLLKLYIIINHELCFIKPIIDDVFRDIPNKDAMPVTVGKFTSYEMVVLYWFLIRKHYYRLRFERMIKILDMKILFNQNILRYIAENDGSKRMTKDEKIQQLINENYTSFTHVSIGNCNYLRGDKIDAYCINNDDRTYKYIFNIRESDRMEDSILAMQQDIKTWLLEKETLQADCKPFIGANTWRNEIDAVIKAFNLGKSTDWLYEDNDSEYI